MSYQEPGVSGYFTNRGWFNVASGNCLDIAKTTNAFFYLYAEATDGSHRVWSGAKGSCVQYPGPYTFSAPLDASECADGQDVREFERLEATKFGTFTWNLDE
ncbi:DUF1036 domain-containing protein [Parablastomonas sp. CN1-191]|uniref:DUF1036 domain-containing protein n=1 Tax=Parablastomonas sp. CN1-191 TaxID=3400908 RepID=UPI003BF9264D